MGEELEFQIQDSAQMKVITGARGDGVTEMSQKDGQGAEPVMVCRFPSSRGLHPHGSPFCGTPQGRMAKGDEDAGILIRFYSHSTCPGLRTVTHGDALLP